MRTFKVPVAGVPRAWMIINFQTNNVPLKARAGALNGELPEPSAQDFGGAELYPGEFEIPPLSPDAIECAEWDSLGEDMESFRRENDFDRDWPDRD